MLMTILLRILAYLSVALSVACYGTWLVMCSKYDTHSETVEEYHNYFPHTFPVVLYGFLSINYLAFTLESVKKRFVRVVHFVFIGIQFVFLALWVFSIL